jgi:hypothetical protein
MFFSKNPAWYQALPPHLRPPESKIKALDTFRRSLRVDDEVFMVLIASTGFGLAA